MNLDVKLQKTRLLNLFDEVNMAEYVFYWMFSDNDIRANHSDCAKSNSFVTKTSAFKYQWYLAYRRNDNFTTPASADYINLWLESSHARNEGNMVFVKLGVNTMQSQNRAFTFCVLPYNDEPVDVREAGNISEEKVQDFFGNKIRPGRFYFVVKIKIIWNEKTVLKLPNSDKLSADFEKLYVGKHSTDVSFVFTNNKVIKAHKLILMGRSPVFQAMFQSDMLESKQNQVEIKDMDPEIFEKLIRYIYTGRMEVTPADKATDILMGADKYALIEYRDYCANELIKRMNVENAANNLIVSSLLNLHSLKAKAIGFILSKKKEVLKTDGYKNLLKNHLHLVAELFEKS